MRRAILLTIVVAFVAGLAFVAATSPGRGATTFSVEPGTQATFPGRLLVAGDRFTCHGILVATQAPGSGVRSSNGLDTTTARDGTVTISRPRELSPL